MAGVYSDEVNIGIAANDGEPVILNETPAIAHVSGENLLGKFTFFSQALVEALYISHII